MSKFTLYKLGQKGMERVTIEDNQKMFQRFKIYLDYVLSACEKKDKKFTYSVDMINKFKANQSTIQKINPTHYTKIAYILSDDTQKKNLLIGGYDLDKNIANELLIELQKIHRESWLKREVAIIQDTKNVKKILQDILDKLTTYYDDYSLPEQQEIDISNIIEDIVEYGKGLGYELETDLFVE